MLRLEALEDRLAPAGSAVIDVNGNLLVTGTSGNDTISVNATNRANVIVVINGVNAGSFSLGPNARVVVNALAGDDFVTVPGAVKAEIHGGDGNDDLTGSNNDDVLFGEGGDDTVKGAAGHDALIGGLGSDYLSGGAGNDVVVGGETDALLTYDVIAAARDSWAGTSDVLLLDAVFTGHVNDPADAANHDTLVGGTGNDAYYGNTNDAFSGFDPAHDKMGTL